MTPPKKHLYKEKYGSENMGTMINNNKYNIFNISVFVLVPLIYSFFSPLIGMICCMGYILMVMVE